MDTDRHKKLKIVVDVISAVAVIVLISILPWCVYDPNFHSHGSPGAKSPIQIKVLMADVIPSVFGIPWLTYRHGLGKKWPFVRTPAFRLLVMAVAAATGTYIGVLLNAK